MPKKYYCDFCHCSFPDNPTNRQKHIEGAAHQANRKFHYDWFKEPEEFIREQQNKPPCRRYLNHGFCEYRLDCRYSHIAYDMAGHPIYPVELIEWLQQRQLADASPSTTVVSWQQQQQQQPPAKRYRLPSGWKLHALPPSLKPPPRQGYDWSDVASW
ncbi:hypothetical protein RO3G_07338 [Lichtheimia corymbifera JMRC:FSU:9682]|uniref:C3H1-type domain-containing protein n=1 Tax=Lichtheimia corymbifera JMRC:FSU:9682 TaxID=1263082 RepID=A0A068RHP6_9FUNG|nr:hypothetical protein RO3G_07338 [Lichtheimia corymbifera JMRC:FSU:9682]